MTPRDVHPPEMPHDPLDAFFDDLRTAVDAEPPAPNDALHTLFRDGTSPVAAPERMRGRRIGFRAAIAGMVAGTAFGGLGIAGALPGPVQHGVASVVVHVGVHLPDDETTTTTIAPPASSTTPTTVRSKATTVPHQGTTTTTSTVAGHDNRGRGNGGGHDDTTTTSTTEDRGHGNTGGNGDSNSDNDHRGRDTSGSDDAHLDTGSVDGNPHGGSNS